MARKKLFAAIDVGSHEISMKIADLVKDEPPKTVESVRQTLAIGTDTYKTGKISQPVLDECAQILQGLARLLKDWQISEDDCRIVATSAFREAANRAFALSQIERASGLSIDVLDNAQERDLRIRAAAALMPDFGQMIQDGALVVDIGAGSVQITVYNQGELIFSQNMLLGSLRVRDLLSDMERRADDFAGLMEEYISGDLENYHQLEPKGITYRHLVVIGGEMDQLKKMAGIEPDISARLTGSQFDLLYGQLLNARPLDLALEKDIPVEHAALLLPSALIVKKLLNYTRCSDIELPAASLCDAILLEFARQRGTFEYPYDQEKDIISACRYLARRFRADIRHADFVEQASLKIFDETTHLHHLPDRCRTLLQAAAILHDTGRYISMTKHHVRTYNLIMANEIIGLSSAERDSVAWTARFHSGRPSTEDRNFQELTDDFQKAVCQMAAILRLADALDNTHQQKINDFAVLTDDTGLTVALSTKQDMTLELWSFEKKRAFFAEVFGLMPKVKIRRPT